MKKLLIGLMSMILCFMSANFVLAQGSTTASMNGKVLDDKGGALPGATVIAVHTPTGSKYGTVTNLDGKYYIRNMNVGGPYKITVTFVGFQDQTKENVFLNLGQVYGVDFAIKEGAQELQTVEITATAGEVIDGERTGAETVVSEQQISALPTISRSLDDFTRMTPQVSVSPNGGISVAGANNRFNSVFIDGAVSNDVFGLSSQGTNGGQSGISPISVDAIEQFQVVISPYDVKMGGFAGGGISAITRSGTNKMTGSTYWLHRNEGLTGKTPTSIILAAGKERERLANFSANTIGFRLGGALKKDKLFFFVNGEIQRDQTPQPFSIGTYGGASKADKLAEFSAHLKTKYGYDAGGYTDNTSEVRGEKFLVRLDWNISDKHKMSVRHSYTKGNSVVQFASSNRTINFYNGGYQFPSLTNSSTLELKSTLRQNLSNNLIVGGTFVNDDRNPLGQAFPRLIIQDGTGSTINAGTEAFSTGNVLKQNIVTLTDNLTLFKGKHTITLGTHNEFYNMYNLFIRQAYGEYTYGSLDAFLKDEKPVNYAKSYSLAAEDSLNSGDGAKAAAGKFNAIQFGLYAQDEWAVNEKLKISAGLRFDIPMFLTQPKDNPKFNSETLPRLREHYTAEELGGIQAGQMPKSQLLVSPRIGFNLDAMGDQSLQVRGGVGVFTSRVPFVWPGAAYSNNGMMIGGVARQNPNIKFEPNPDKTPTASDFGAVDKVPAGEMNLFAKDYKYPQVFRTSLGFDKKLPFGMVATLEGIYTKTLNHINYRNVNVVPSVHKATGADNRPLYNRANFIDPTYTFIMVGSNTNKGYSYNFTAQLQKPFKNGFNASLAYTYGRSLAVNDGLASQNSSNWRRVQTVNGKNNPDLSYSDFDLGSRVVGFVSYKLNYLKMGATTFSLFYNGQSGERFSYVSGGTMINDDSQIGFDLIYVPAQASDINFKDFNVTANGVTTTVTAAQQSADYFNYVSNDPYLSKMKGKYAERNGARMPFQNVMDFRLLQDFYIKTANGTKHNLQLSLDIFNFGNLISKDWGRRYFIGSNSMQIIQFTNFKSPSTGDYTPIYTFNKPQTDIWNTDDSGVMSSRWQGQIGVRYSF